MMTRSRSTPETGTGCREAEPHGNIPITPSWVSPAGSRNEPNHTSNHGNPYVEMSSHSVLFFRTSHANRWLWWQH
eukprot:3083441-Amphidinium_carterae.1